VNVFSNHDSLRAVSNLTDVATAPDQRRAAARMLGVLQLALKGGGVLYQGEELGLPHPDIPFAELRDPWGINLWPDIAGRDGARTPIPWQADAPQGGFTAAPRPWLCLPQAHRAVAADAQYADPDPVLAIVRAWIAWRGAVPLLRFGGEHVHPPETPDLIVWDRYSTDETITCAVNFGLQTREMPARLVADKTPMDAPQAVAAAPPEPVVLPPLGFGLFHGHQAPMVQVETPLSPI